MPIGMIALIVVAILIYFGVAHRVLDRMGLTDRVALLFLVAMFVGSYIPDIPLTSTLGINVGGGLIPIAFAIYLLTRAEPHEVVRALTATALTTGAIYIAMKIVPVEPTYSTFLDPLYIFALLAGTIAYLAGRSRRTAFIAGTMGIVLTDIVSRIEIALTGGHSYTVIGGAGVFDAVLISGIIAVGLAEIVGETREMLQGGSTKEKTEEQTQHNNLHRSPATATMEIAQETTPDPANSLPTEPNLSRREGADNEHQK